MKDTSENENISDRSLKQAVSNSFKSGELKMTIINENGGDGECVEDTGGPCETCKKRIGNTLDAYSYHIINSSDHISIEKMMFCCRKCWEDYLVKKAGEIKT